MIEEIDSDELTQLISDSKIVFIDCYADWCHPCKILHPILEELDEKFQGKGLKIVSLDVDQNRSFSEENQIAVIPTIFVYSKGKRVVFDSGDGKKMDRLMGVVPGKVYERIIERLLFEPI